MRYQRLPSSVKDSRPHISVAGEPSQGLGSAQTFPPFLVCGSKTPVTGYTHFSWLHVSYGNRTTKPSKEAPKRPPINLVIAMSNDQPATTQKTNKQTIDYVFRAQNTPLVEWLSAADDCMAFSCLPGMMEAVHATGLNLGRGFRRRVAITHA